MAVNVATYRAATKARHDARNAVMEKPVNLRNRDRIVTLGLSSEA